MSAPQPPAGSDLDHPEQSAGDAAARGPRTAADAAGRRTTAFLDGALDVAVTSFAVWTVLHSAMLLGLPLAVAAAVWTAATVGLVVLRARRSFGLSVPAHAPWGALALAAGTAALSAVVVRVDLDDAWYIVQAAWVGERGELPVRDILFTHGQWPRTVGNTPGLVSLESWYGTVARFTGLPAGDVAYRYFTPLAAFAAVWALWLLLRSWRARRPFASLALAMVFLVLGGYAHTTFGNMHLARIWQGKAAMVAILVPYLYAVLASVLRRDRGAGRPTAAVVLLGLAIGVDAVGLSSTGVFLVPLAAAVGGLALLWRRDWAGLTVPVAVTVGPIAAGIATILAASGAYGGGRGFAPALYGAPWPAALADGRVAVAAGVAATVVVLGVVAPRWWGTVDASLRAPLVGLVAGGLLVSVGPVYDVLVDVMGSEAVAFRLAWVVPLPALIGLVASLPARRLRSPVGPVVAVVLALVVSAGTPLWDASNHAFLGRPGSWKVRAPEDLLVARWIVEQEPAGRYLAPVWVTQEVAIVSTEPRPVGGRLEYVASLRHLPYGQVDERILLQQISDGDARTEDNREAALEALDALDVTLACVAWNDEFTDDLLTLAGFRQQLVLGPWTCSTR